MGGIEDFVRVQVPVLYVSFDQARDDDKQQHQYIDAGEHLINHG